MRCTSGTNLYLCIFHHTHEWDESHLIKTYTSNEPSEPQLRNWSLSFINLLYPSHSFFHFKELLKRLMQSHSLLLTLIWMWQVDTFIIFNVLYWALKRHLLNQLIVRRLQLVLSGRCFHSLILMFSKRSQFKFAIFKLAWFIWPIRVKGQMSNFFPHPNVVFKYHLIIPLKTLKTNVSLH